MLPAAAVETGEVIVIVGAEPAVTVAEVAGTVPVDVGVVVADGVAWHATVINDTAARNATSSSRWRSNILFIFRKPPLVRHGKTRRFLPGLCLGK